MTFEGAKWAKAAIKIKLADRVVGKTVFEFIIRVSFGFNLFCSRRSSFGSMQDSTMMHHRKLSNIDAWHR